MRLNHQVRRGFTLVEVLVAAGLSMLIMLMVTQAFRAGMDTLSQLKSVGEMQQRLRTCEIILRSDLESDHFESRYGPKVSDQRLDLTVGYTLTNDAPPWRPPIMGFFRIMSDHTSAEAAGLSPAPVQSCQNEGQDLDGNPSTRAVDHMLHMTVRRNVIRGDRQFAAAMPENILTSLGSNSQKLQDYNSINLVQMKELTSQAFSSEWAEVVYFLDIINPTGLTPGGTPIYGLYRRVRVLGSSGATMLTRNDLQASAVTSAELNMSRAVSAAPGNGLINGPKEIRTPSNRLGGALSSRTVGGAIADSNDTITHEVDAYGNATGSDLLVADVISFEVKGDWDSPPGYASPSANPSTYDFPFNVLPTALPRTSATYPTPIPLNGRRVFDTWSEMPPAPAAPLPRPAPYSSDEGWTQVWNVAWANSFAVPNSFSGPNYLGTDMTQFLIPQPIRLRAVQIKVRVWDRKNNMARQMTIVQSL